MGAMNILAVFVLCVLSGLIGIVSTSMFMAKEIVKNKQESTDNSDD